MSHYPYAHSEHAHKPSIQLSREAAQRHEQAQSVREKRSRRPGPRPLLWLSRALAR